MKNEFYELEDDCIDLNDDYKELKDKYDDIRDKYSLLEESKNKEQCGDKEFEEESLRKFKIYQVEFIY